MIKKAILLLLLPLFLAGTVEATEPETEDIVYENPDSLNLQIDSTILEMYRIESSLTYETGTIDLSDVASITVPEGFKFLDASQSQTVLSTLWNNPVDESTLGMLFPEDISPLSENFSFAIEISYSAEGHIKDDDAKDIDYDELLEEMQADILNANVERQNLGYPEMELVGWASPPYYDEENKKLHWAKELKFSGTEVNTLNYNIRALGREGVLVLNIISDITQLETVKPHVNTILNCVSFKEGNKYSDFNPDLDKVAAYGVGGLIAGKVLAKTGFLALLAKFWKLIVIGVIAVGGFIKKFLFGGKKEDDVTPKNEEETPVP